MRPQSQLQSELLVIPLRSLRKRSQQRQTPGEMADRLRMG